MDFNMNSGGSGFKNQMYLIDPAMDMSIKSLQNGTSSLMPNMSITGITPDSLYSPGGSGEIFSTLTTRDEVDMMNDVGDNFVNRILFGSDLESFDKTSNLFEQFNSPFYEYLQKEIKAKQEQPSANKSNPFDVTLPTEAELQQGTQNPKGIIPPEDSNKKVEKNEAPPNAGKPEEVEGAVDIKDSGKTIKVNDKGGNDENKVSGNNNNVEFTGDKGKNEFKIGGDKNNVFVHNLGGDDKVKLEGSKDDWKIVEEGEVDGGHFITYKNEKTGSTLKVASDKGDRGSDWLKDKVKFNSN
jgi:hypothetical protein